MSDIEKYMISFSGGRTSAYMTNRLLGELDQQHCIVCFANTGKEAEETLYFVHQCSSLWHGRVVWLEYDPDSKFRIVKFETASRHGEPYSSLINKRKFLPNIVARYCTQELKIKLFKHYMMSLGHCHWINVVGIRYDEPRRWHKINANDNHDRWETWLPLVDWKITKQVVLDFWKTMPFDLQLPHYLGNCDLCFLKGKNKLKRIITEEPSTANWWIEQEEKVNGTFHKGYSYAQLIDLMRRSPTLFDYDYPDLDCYCS